MEDEERLRQIKEELQNDEFLVKKFNNITKKLMKDEPGLKLPDAQEMALALLAFGYYGSEKVSEDQMGVAMTDMQLRIMAYNAKGLNE